MDIQKIKELAMANGFSLKEQASGDMDLHSYVYEFAQVVAAEAKASAVPDGFVLVPRDATDEMISHGVNALDRKRTARSCWNAMVEAAGSPPKERVSWS